MLSNYEPITLYVPDVTSEQYQNIMASVKVWTRSTPGAPSVECKDARHVDNDVYSVSPVDHPMAASLETWLDTGGQE